MSDLISSDLSDDEKNSWETDQRVFNAMNAEFDFGLDAAASNANHKCFLYLTIEDNALTRDWSKITSKAVWLNPPYGRGCIKLFMDKCVEQKNKGMTIVVLVPATLDAKWTPINETSEIRIITGGRLQFINPATSKPVRGNTKGSMFVIFRPSKMPCTVRLIDRNELIGG